MPKLNELHPWRCHYLISETVTSTLQLGSSVNQLCGHCWSWCFQSTMSCTCLPRISWVLVRWFRTRWRISMKLTFYKQPWSAAVRIQRWVLWVLLMKWSPLCTVQVPAAPHWDGGGARERTYKQILESLEYIQIHHSLCLLSCGWPLPQYEGKHGQIGDMLVLSQVNTKASLHDSQEQLSELSSSKSANTLMSIHTSGCVKSLTTVEDNQLVS